MQLKRAPAAEPYPASAGGEPPVTEQSHRQARIQALVHGISQRPSEEPQRRLVISRQPSTVDEVLHAREGHPLLHHVLDLLAAAVEREWRGRLHLRASF